MNSGIIIILRGASYTTSRILPTINRQIWTHTSCQRNYIILHYGLMARKTNNDRNQSAATAAAKRRKTDQFC